MVWNAPFGTTLSGQARAIEAQRHIKAVPLSKTGFVCILYFCPGQNLTRTITGPHDANGESFSDHSVIIPIIIVPVTTMHSSQVGLVDCCADSSAQTRSCVLVGSKMNPAVNASVGDVVGNLPE